MKYVMKPNKVLTELKRREYELEKLAYQCKQSLQNVPKGKLRINQTKNRIQYYYRINPKDRIGSYIHEDNIELASTLAQKDYDEKLNKAIESELEVIHKMLKQYQPANYYDIFDAMNRNRQDLITSRLQNDEEFIADWMKEEYEGLGFDPNDKIEHYTAKGERVRSKSEIIIANTLCHYNIPYKYEAPLYLNDYGNVVYPDFTCLNVRERKEIIWEHLGMMGKEEYANKNVKKLESYAANGYHQGDNLIMTMETQNVPISSVMVENIVKRYLL